MSDFKEFPKFVWMLSPSGFPGSALHGNEVKGVDNRAYYYRDAGQWGVYAKWLEDGTLVTYDNADPCDHLNDVVLTPCTKEEWMKDNEGYVPSLDTEEQYDELPF